MSEAILKRQSKKKTVLVTFLLGLLVVGMFGFGYVLVPIYDVMCKAWGINGKPGGQTAASNTVDESRWVTVQFMGTTNASIPWKFYPLTKFVRVHPGQNTRVAFFAQNESGKAMTIQAIPSVTPGLAAKHLKKTECFCFTQQTLQAGQKMEMPILFHIDSDLPKYIKVMTVSYTIFDVTGKNYKNNKTQGRIGT